MKKISELIGVYHGHDVHIDSASGQKSCISNLFYYSTLTITKVLPSEMENDLKLPKSLMCGPFKTEIVDRRLWRSSGKVAEPLKRNQFDQMFCTLHGRSDWIVYDKRFV